MDESSILFWEEPDVHSFFCSLGFKGYEQQIKEHQISGEILVQCDHEALKDVGIHSVGQRLAILKAVYQLKLQNDVPIEEGHWVPPSEFMDQIMVESPAGIIPPERMFELLRERDDRIRALETSIARLNEQVLGMRDEVYGLSRSLHTKEPPIPINKLRPNQASPTASGFARQHLRNGSLAAGPSTSSHAQSGTGTDGSGSPGASPANSPIRSTHDGSHGPEQSTAANVTAPPAGALLSYSTSLRRRAAKLADVTHGANGLLGTPSHPTAGGDGAPVSPVPSPLPSSVVVSPANGAEPPTPTAAYPQISSSSSVAAAQWNGEDTPVSDTVPLSQLLSTTVTPSGLMSGLGSGPNNRQLDDSGHGLTSQQRPATSSTSPSSAPIALPNRPSTSATSLSSMSDMTQALMTPSTSTSTGTSSGSASADRGGRTSSSSSTIDNPYKSFRVTLEDPCYKVLPAALKKYKINDDWRQYALFICYGSQERCLSYDEKPLLLFQKLKDSKQNPVFMLRHIKDIKSPIAHALEKHTTRREKRAREGKHITGEGKEGSVRDFSRATRLHHPSNLQPVKASPSSPNPGATGGGEEEKDKIDDEKEGKGQGYALAIYPYMADREDEFDVAVGDTFVILNKTKGWWVVHRDTKAKKGSDIVRSGWVPQGCLLETSVPPSSFSTTPVSSSTPINPLSIVSMSTPGLALMDYTQRGSDEVNMRKGDKLRVFKRYNHWSYVIKEATGERGWTPSWFVGKLSSSSSGSAQSTPTSALATSISGHTPSSATPLSALPVAKDAASLPATQGGETTPTSASMSFN